MSYGRLQRRGDIVRDESWFGVALDPALSTRWEEFTLARDALASLPPGRVLDAGCGFKPGHHMMPEIAAALGWQVEAIDLLTPKWGESARSLWDSYPPNGLINRRIMDMRATDYPDNHFDAYLNLSVLEHLPPDDMDRSLDEAYRVLKPGGLIVLTMDGDHHVPSDRWEFGARYMPGVVLQNEDGLPVTFWVGTKREKPIQRGDTITIAATVYNEADRFLPRALECWSAYADRIVIQDNGSTDDTKAVCEAFGAEVHGFVVPMEGNETAVMSNLWDLATKDADWVVFMDADQCFAGDFRPHLKGDRCGFDLFDLWSPNTYRVDRWWQVRPWCKAVNMANHRAFVPEWPQRGWHTGHIPSNIHLFGPLYPIPREMGVLHYACASPELRDRQFRAYMGRRAHLTPREVMHARTIMDEAPNTPELPFTPAWTLI